MPLYNPTTGGGGSGITNYWSGYTGQASSWTSTGSGYNDGTNSGGNAITSRASNGITVTAGGSNVAGITFTPSSSSAIYLIMAKFQGGAATQSSAMGYRLTDGTIVVDETGFGGTFNGLGLEGVLSGNYAPGTGSAVTLKIQMATTAGGNGGINTSSGGGALSASVVEWTVIQIK